VSEAFDDSLPSWNNGAAKTAILDFVRETTEKSSKYAEPKDRIATFDQDDTLWTSFKIIAFGTGARTHGSCRRRDVGDG
jgi:hypothetical protein